MRWLQALILVAMMALAPPPAEAVMSLDEAVRMVQRQTDGRILSADRVRRGDRIIYRIKVLTPDGHVRVITVDGGRVGNGNDDRRRDRW